jgi:glutathione S-transferase
LAFDHEMKEQPMALKLYDLAAADDRVRFSPHCWRARMAIAHKGLAVKTVPWRFTDKDAIAFSGQGATPVLVDGDKTVVDSWEIARYLDAAYGDRPRLFEGPQAEAHAYFIKVWCERVLHPGVAKQIMADLFDMLDEKDKPYFRESREKRFGMTLEEFSAGAEAALPAFRGSLAPLRATLEKQPYLGGAGPSFADHIAFGAFQWARTSSSRDLLEAGDPIADWRRRLLEMFDGLAASVPARGG